MNVRQACDPEPTNSVIASAIDLAEKSLNHYQIVIDEISGLRGIAEIIPYDSGPVGLGVAAVNLLRRRLSRGERIDVLELATLFANVDAAAINAALASETLVIGADRGPNQDMRLSAAEALLGNVQEFKESSDRLWVLLEAHLRWLRTLCVSMDRPEADTPLIKAKTPGGPCGEV
jgi:hypothetical protein